MQSMLALTELGRTRLSRINIRRFRACSKMPASPGSAWLDWRGRGIGTLLTAEMGSVQRFIEDKCVAVAERAGSIVEERRRKQRAPAMQHLEQVLGDGDDESRVAAIARQQVEPGQQLPAKEDRAAGEIGRNRYEEGVPAA
jgi:hypothetical protein